MTYLQLCQFVARESGTISGVAPTAVTGQTGRLLKVVEWVKAAWDDIQNRETAWRWMRGEFSGSLTSGTKRYTSASFSISRWAEWQPHTDDDRDDAFTVYKTSDGVAEEGRLLLLPYEEWRRRFDRGTDDTGKPTHFAISPAGELCVGPTPDATYTIRGVYRKSPQELSADGDVPECPARFHRAIGYRALLLLHKFDEADWPVGAAREEFGRYMDALQRDQLPDVRITSGPLA